MMVILLHSVVIGLVTLLVIIGTGYDLMLQHRRRQQDAKSPGK
jgi:hypothetical protein